MVSALWKVSRSALLKLSCPAIGWTVFLFPVSKDRELESWLTCTSVSLRTVMLLGKRCSGFRNSLGCLTGGIRPSIGKLCCNLSCERFTAYSLDSLGSQEYIFVSNWPSDCSFSLRIWTKLQASVFVIFRLDYYSTLFLYILCAWHFALISIFKWNCL